MRLNACCLGKSRLQLKTTTLIIKQTNESMRINQCIIRKKIHEDGLKAKYQETL